METNAVEKEKKGPGGGGGGGGVFKFNAEAPEFVPRSRAPAPPAQQQAPGMGCYYYDPWLQHFSGDGCAGAGAIAPADWFYFANQELAPQLARGGLGGGGRDHRINGSSGSDTLQRIVKQVEFQFSDANLVASDYMMRLINKDPEGYVPIAAIVSQKKLKSFGSNIFMLAKALRPSPKLTVSEDGKRIRRKHAFTEREKEDIQARTVVVENLPEQCTRQNIEMIFSIIGRVKHVRICRPQEQNSARPSKGDILISNKVHALVEFESADQAEMAAEKLNDERNWRKGLRVRVMLRRTPRSVMRNRKGDHSYFDEISDDDDRPLLEPPDSPHTPKPHSEQHGEDSPGGGGKRWASSRGKLRGGGGGGSQPLGHNGRGVLSPAPQHQQQLGSAKSVDAAASKLSPRKALGAGGAGLPGSPQLQSQRGPRMPDGTRGFTMGRGKPLRPAVSCPPQLEV